MSSRHRSWANNLRLLHTATAPKPCPSLPYRSLSIRVSVARVLRLEQTKGHTELIVTPTGTCDRGSGVDLHQTFTCTSYNYIPLVYVLRTYEALVYMVRGAGYIFPRSSNHQSVVFIPQSYSYTLPAGRQLQRSRAPAYCAGQQRLSPPLSQAPPSCPRSSCSRPAALPWSGRR